MRYASRPTKATPTGAVLARHALKRVPRPAALGNQALLRRLQAKLTIGAVDDPLEREADAVAEKVMRMPDAAVSASVSPLRISRKCAACEEEEKQTVRSKREGARVGEGEALATVDDALRSPGEPLDTATRAFFEPRFGHDFSGVRVHRDDQAGRSAQKLGALAYAVQKDVVFARGAYAPTQDTGRRLIAHELTHVVQQGNSRNTSVQCDTPPAQPAPSGGAPPAAPAAAVPCPPTTAVKASTLSQYVDLMKCAETRLSSSPRDMLTTFRQLYYGSQAWSVSSNPVWDDVVKCPRPVGDPRPALGIPLLDSLQGSQEVSGVDVGHVFVGLESMMCPTPKVTPAQTVLGMHANINLPNEDFATWAGDLGAAVSAHSACPGLGAAAATSDDCFHLPGSPTLTNYLKASAPDQDLQGDIDSFVLRAQGLGVPCVGSGQKTATLPSGNLSDVFQSYYNNASSALGTAHASNAHCFLDAIGATLDPTGKTITNRAVIVGPLQARVAEFAFAFYYKTTKSKFGALGVYMGSGMNTDSGIAVNWFLTWLESKL
jgi:hypothetical protein